MIRGGSGAETTPSSSHDRQARFSRFVASTKYFAGSRVHDSLSMWARSLLVESLPPTIAGISFERWAIHQQSAKEATIRMDTERIREAADEMNSGGTPQAQTELETARLMLEKEKTI